MNIKWDDNLETKKPTIASLKPGDVFATSEELWMVVRMSTTEVLALVSLYGGEVWPYGGHSSGVFAETVNGRQLAIDTEVDLVEAMLHVKGNK